MKLNEVKETLNEWVEEFVKELNVEVRNSEQLRRLFDEWVRESGRG